MGRKTIQERINANIAWAGECWEWQGYRDKGGYGRIYCSGKSWLAHRIAYAIANGCVRPDHLFAGTAKDNSADMVAKGRSMKGKKRRMLSEDDISGIWYWHSEGDSMEVLSRRYKVPVKRISNIINGKSRIDASAGGYCFD